MGGGKAVAEPNIMDNSTKNSRPNCTNISEQYLLEDNPKV